MEFNLNILSALSSFLTAFIVSYFSIPSIVRVAHKKHLFDEPGERSSHTLKTPTLGGLAIFGGLVISSSIWVSDSKMPEYQYIISALVVIFFIGLKDDILIIAPITKFIGQFVAGFILIVFGGIRITNMHGLFGINEMDYYNSLFISLLTILVILNGFNFIDGVDGLSASIGIITSATFVTWFILVKEYQFANLGLALIGALLAFFFFNVFGKENKIFMGDTGSLIIGLIISILVIKFNELNIDKSKPYSIYPAPAVAFGILIIPLFDLMRIMFIRTIIGRPLLSADKNHLHHQLLKLNLNHFKVTFIISMVNILFIGFVFFSSTFMTIRRQLLLIFIIALVLSYIPPCLIERNKKKNILLKH